MRLTGITGTGSGKLGSSVFSVTSGTQIVRQYQPVVTNPSTAKQVNNRARLKLMSQLSAVMADVIAIPKNGMQSARNIFVQENYKITSAENGQATVDLSAIALTKGGMQIPAVIAERNADTSIDVALAMKADQLVSRVVYIMFYRNNQGELQLADSAVVETAGDDGTFPWSFGYQQQDVIVYAYGIFDKNSMATASFGNYSVATGTQMASLIANRKVSESDYLISKTQGIVLIGETTAEIAEVTINGTNIASSGYTSVPYANSIAANVVTSKGDGMYVRLTVDGVGSTPQLIEVGYNTLNVAGLAGGENIRVQIGTMSGTAFVPAKTFGGTAALAAQPSAFTSVRINGTSIASTGNTQVAQALNSAISVNASGVYNKYLRVSINGTAKSPVAFTNGAAQDVMLTPAIGDVVTFQIGRMVNGTFVEDVAYGGSAIVAEVPATFDAVMVNGTNVASSGSTNIIVSDPNDIIVDTQNAIGKYLGILNGNNQVLSVHAISQNRTTLLQEYAAGDTIKFAIGTGSDTSSFVAQTNFGGSVVFTEAPSVGITSLTIGSTVINRNSSLGIGTMNVTAATTGADENTQVFTFVKQQQKPSVGTAISNVTPRLTISSGQVTGSINFEDQTYYWAAIGTWNESAGTFTPAAVYDYWCFSSDPDN